MPDPVKRLDKNGLMFQEQLNNLTLLEDDIIEDEEQKELRRKQDDKDFTGELLDSVIGLLGVLRKRF